MKKRDKHLLLSMDVRPGKGGIARVARLVYDSLSFDKAYSLHGSSSDEEIINYCSESRWLFTLKALAYIFFHRPSLIVFDHLYLTRLLIFIPDNFLRKVVVFLHDEEAWSPLSSIHKITLGKCNRILCNSEFTRKRFVENNEKFSSKTKVCHLGGVPHAFLNVTSNISEKYADWINDSRPYCLFVSRLWKEHSYKGHWQLLEAFKTYLQKTDGESCIRLAIIGSGDDAEGVSNFIHKEKLNDSVTLFQNVGDIDLAHFYKKSVCLIFPSIREGFGMVYLEAMFFGKACIGIANQPAEEIIIHGKTGVLLKSNDVKELLPVLQDIQSYPDKYLEYGNGGYKRYLDYFSNTHFKIRFLSAID